MPCIENKCALCEIYSNTNAGMACDEYCYFDENTEMRNKYLISNPEETKCYKDGK